MRAPEQNAESPITEDYDIMSKNEPLMKNELLMEIEVELHGTAGFAGPHSKVTLLPFSAKTEGKYFTGSTVMDGVDTQRTDASGRFSLSARYMLRGKDYTGQECSIFIENNGSSLDNCIPAILTDSEALSFLEQTPLRATVEPKEGGVTVRIYRAS